MPMANGLGSRKQRSWEKWKAGAQWLLSRYHALISAILTASFPAIPALSKVVNPLLKSAPHPVLMLDSDAALGRPMYVLSEAMITYKAGR